MKNRLDDTELFTGFADHIHLGPAPLGVGLSCSLGVGLQPPRNDHPHPCLFTEHPMGSLRERVSARTSEILAYSKFSISARS